MAKEKPPANTGDFFCLLPRRLTVKIHYRRNKHYQRTYYTNQYQARHKIKGFV